MTESLLQGLATEDTQLLLQELLDAIKAQAYNSNADSYRVGTGKSRFRDDFRTFDEVENWTVVQQGVGQTISVNGTANGARYLNINTGTTANSELILLSKHTFHAPVKKVVGLSMSQRIANQEVYVELVEVDENGDVVVDQDDFTAPFTIGARNCFGMLFDGTSPTTMKYTIRAQGISELAPAAVTGLTTLATGTAPNFNPASEYQMWLETEIANITARAVNSASAGTQIINRTDYVPNTEYRYAVRIRVKNLATAPASATDVRIHYVRILDAVRNSVDFAMIGGSNLLSQAAPVNVLAIPTVTATTNMGAANQVLYADTVAQLAANAVFTGTARDAGSTTVSYKKFVAYFAGSQASDTDGCKIQHSTDGTTWYDSESGSKVIGKTLRLEADVVARYYRTYMKNGTVIQTGMGIHSCFERL